jgi:hypothetical protein
MRRPGGARCLNKRCVRSLHLHDRSMLVVVLTGFASIAAVRRSALVAPDGASCKTTERA